MGTTEEKLAYLEETKEKLAQGLAAQGLTPAGTFRAMAEQVAEIPSGTPLPSLTNPGTAADLLSGKRLIDGTGRVVTGSMPDIVPQSMELESGQAYTIPRGYHSGSGIITAKGEAGGSFAVPLVVTVEAGATVTATNGTDTVTGMSDGTATLILPSGGTWTVTAQMDGGNFVPNELEIPASYEISVQKIGRLPVEYVEVEYIANPNSGYIIESGLPSQLFRDYRVELKVTAIDVKNDGYCSVIGNNGNNLDMWVTARGRVAASGRMGNRSLQGFTLYSLSPFEFLADGPKNIYTYNGVAIETVDFVQPDNPETPYIFWQNGSVHAIYTRPIYYIRIYESTQTATGNLLLDYVPCVDPDGTAGFYELVNGVFYSSSISGKPFVAGPPVQG